MQRLPSSRRSEWDAGETVAARGRLEPATGISPPERIPGDPNSPVTPTWDPSKDHTATSGIKARPGWEEAAAFRVGRSRFEKSLLVRPEGLRVSVTLGVRPEAQRQLYRSLSLCRGQGVSSLP